MGGKKKKNSSIVDIEEIYQFSWDINKFDYFYGQDKGMKING